MLTDGLECCGLLWCFYQTLILTAPIHCRASIDETLISTNLMKTQTHPNLVWTEDEHIFMFCWTVSFNTQPNTSFSESGVIQKHTSTVGVGQDPLRHVIMKAVGQVEEAAESSWTQTHRQRSIMGSFVCDRMGFSNLLCSRRVLETLQRSDEPSDAPLMILETCRTIRELLDHKTSHKAE